MSETLTDVTLILCNGDEVFPEYVITYDVHGVTNNRTNVQGTISTTGTGYSSGTSEVYEINDVNKINEHHPIRNGAFVLTSHVDGVLVGDQGSKDNFKAKSHFTFSANGQLAADHFSFVPDCQ